MGDNTASDKPCWPASKEFKFIVGPEKREFMVHSELVAQQSKPLRTLITNGMKESQERVIKWPHIDSETFERFVQFIYQHDFHSPGFVTSDHDPEFRDGYFDTEVEDNIFIRRAWKRFRTRKRYQEPTFYEVDELVYDIPNLADAYTTITKVHILAYYYDITHLMNFCRAKLHTLMEAYYGALQISDALRLCMTEPGAEGLRELMLEYCALGLSRLHVCPKFKSVIAEFPVASIGIMEKRRSFSQPYVTKQLGRRLPSPSPDSDFELA